MKHVLDPRKRAVSWGLSYVVIFALLWLWLSGIWSDAYYVVCFLVSIFFVGALSLYASMREANQHLGRVEPPEPEIVYKLTHWPVHPFFDLMVDLTVLFVLAASGSAWLALLYTAHLIATHAAVEEAFRLINTMGIKSCQPAQS